MSYKLLVIFSLIFFLMASYFVFVYTKYSIFLFNMIEILILIFERKKNILWKIKQKISIQIIMS